MSEAPQQLFQCRNGMMILEEDASRKLFRIKEEHPEKGDGTATAYEWSEMGMAELFGVVYNEECRFCPEHKTWYTYYDGAWRKDEGEILVSSKIKEFVRLMNIYCIEIEDDDLRGNYLKFLSKLEDRRMRDRVAKDARDVLSIRASDFDKNPYLINCLNGTYDLQTLSFYHHRWSDFLTMQTTFSHTVSKNVRCERWEQFIMEVCSGDADKADFLQRALGYSIIGKSNEACMFILWGKTTRNGKSTLLGTIERMLGDYSKVAPVGLICREKGERDAESASPTLAGLKGKRFVTMAESNEYGKLDEEKIKQYTGGEEITSRALYQSSVTWLPQFTLWLSCNDLPAVRDKSLFASERVRVIEFSRHFSQEEQDKSLSEYFDGAEARSGIFMWLVRGYQKYLRRGLAMPEQMQKVIRKYEKDNDIVEQFLEAYCEKGEGLRVKPKELYSKYKMWAKNEGYYVMSTTKFYADVERHMDWTEGRRVFQGYDYFFGFALKQTIVVG